MLHCLKPVLFLRYLRVLAANVDSAEQFPDELNNTVQLQLSRMEGINTI